MKRPAPPDYWACACTRTNPITRKREVKLNHPTVARCRRCHATRPAPESPPCSASSSS